jgi:BASS family bile acid:Na+ symporter
MMRKTVTTVLALIFCFTFFAGCEQETEPTQTGYEQYLGNIDYTAPVSAYVWEQVEGEDEGVCGIQYRTVTDFNGLTSQSEIPVCLYFYSSSAHGSQSLTAGVEDLAQTLVGQVLFIGILMVLILDLEQEDRILLEAIMMCVISPCATAAAVVTQKLGGSLEQMTTYTFLSNFITVLLVPVCFPLIEPSANMEFWPAFLKILNEVFCVLVVPMILACFVKHYMKSLHRRIVAVRDLSYYLWACSLMIVTGTTVKNIVHAEAGIFLLMAIALLGLVVCIIQSAVGRYIGRFFGHAQESGQALGQKNTAFAIWLSNAYLNPLSSVGPGCYILWQNIINSIEIWQKRKE